MEATIEITETTPKGLPKTVRERYTVEAASFIDGEERIRKELNYSNRPIKTVSGMLRPKYGEICFSDDAAAENWYKVKVDMKEEVEVRTRKGGTRTKTKTVSHYYLVQSDSNENARKAIGDEIYKGSNADYEIADVVKTRILDVLEKDKHLKSAEKKEN
jgi:hypothetical protein